MRHAFQAIVLAVVAFALYANTIGSDYAFDDGVVIKNNSYVQQGWSGIGAIMTRDAFDSYFRQQRVADRQLSGGRYRPLSIMTFAVEQSIFGDNPHVSHFINALLYAATAVVLLALLRTQVLRPDVPWAFLATLLFVVHPIHTEAVANIKGRDELLSFLFIVVTLLFALRHDAGRRTRDLVIALAAYLLALLSKEYGLVLLALLPLAFYLCNGRGIFESLRRTWPYFAIAIVYIALRLNAIGFHMVASQEILSNPYLYATRAEALATKLAVLLRYVSLLAFPYPLAADYSYRQIPYIDFSSVLPWASLLLHGALIVWGLMLLRRRDIRAFAVFFYLAMLAIVSNFVIDIGAPMGDRLVYHASLGFVLIIAWAALALTRRAGAAAPGAHRIAGAMLAGIVICVASSAAVWTFERNRDWTNDGTLFTHDVLVSPQSAIVNADASLYYIAEADKPQNSAQRNALLEKSVAYSRKALEIHPTFMSARVNLGLALFKLDRLDDAEREWKAARDMRANDPLVQNNLRALGETYFNNGLDDGSEKRFEQALVWFDKALRFDPNNAVIWTNIGKSRYWLKQNDAAREAWQKALQLDPQRDDAQAGLNAIGKSP